MRVLFVVDIYVIDQFCRYTDAEGRSKALEDSDSILRANEGKSNCLRGKERMVRVFLQKRSMLF